MDPEVPLSIVDMGLIYGINVNENNDVDIKMTMTTQGCPLHETMVDDVKRYTKKVSGVNNVSVEMFGIHLGLWIRCQMRQKP